MSGVIDNIERAQLRRIPVFQAGDRLRVHFQVVEGTRRRTQVFEGIVIKRQGSGARETFTVRKQSFGVGVERTFPVHSPKIEQIETAARGDVRRAKLYYLRDRVGRSARVRERRFTGQDEEVYVDGVMPPPEADAAAGVMPAPEADESAPQAEADAAPDPRDEGADEVAPADGDRAEAAAQDAGTDEAAAPDADATPEADADQAGAEKDDAPDAEVPGDAGSDAAEDPESRDVSGA